MCVLLFAYIQKHLTHKLLFFFFVSATATVDSHLWIQWLERLNRRKKNVRECCRCFFHCVNWHWYVRSYLSSSEYHSVCLFVLMLVLRNVCCRYETASTTYSSLCFVSYRARIFFLLYSFMRSLAAPLCGRPLNQICLYVQYITSEALDSRLTRILRTFVRLVLHIHIHSSQDAYGRCVARARATTRKSQQKKQQNIKKKNSAEGSMIYDGRMYYNILRTRISYSSSFVVCARFFMRARAVCRLCIDARTTCVCAFYCLGSFVKYTFQHVDLH